jgi:hypothetical protein
MRTNEQFHSSDVYVASYLRGMKDEKDTAMLIGVVADICELLANVILLAPTEQREELCRFARMEVAAISDVSDRKAKHH